MNLTGIKQDEFHLSSMISSHELGTKTTILKNGQAVLHLISPVFKFSADLDAADVFELKKDDQFDEYSLPTDRYELDPQVSSVLFESEITAPLITHFMLEGEPAFKEFSGDESREFLDFIMKATNSYVALNMNDGQDSGDLNIAVKQYLGALRSFPPEIEPKFTIETFEFGSMVAERADGETQEFYDLVIPMESVPEILASMEDPSDLLRFFPDELPTLAVEPAHNTEFALPKELIKDFSEIKKDDLFPKVVIPKIENRTKLRPI